jgi:hypothetical protein
MKISSKKQSAASVLDTAVLIAGDRRAVALSSAAA